MKKLDGHVQVVGLDRVESLSLQGWRVVDSFETDELIEFEEQTPAPQPNSGGYSYQQPLITTKKTSIKVRVRKFLMQLDETSAIGKLGEKLAIAQLALKEAGERRWTHEKEREKLVERIQELEKQATARTAELQVTANQLQQAKELLQLERGKVSSLTYAQDKLKGAIGAIRFAEIMGPP